MAEQTITVTKFGETMVWQNAHSDGHAYANSGNVLLYVENLTASTATVQHTEQTACDFGHPNVHATDDAANGGTTRIWRSRNVLRWNDASGKAHVTWTTSVPGDATLRVAAVDYSET